MIHRVRRVWLIAGTALVVLLVTASWLLPRMDGAGQANTLTQVGRVFTVTQFVQPGSGPLWTTKRKTLYFIHGVLRRAPMQPVADYVLNDNGSGSNGEGGLALAAGPSDALVSSLLRFALLRPLLPHTVDNPVLGIAATFRVEWIGCPSRGCSRSPWQLASGGE